MANPTPTQKHQEEIVRRLRALADLVEVGDIYVPRLTIDEPSPRRLVYTIECEPSLLAAEAARLKKMLVNHTR